MPKFHNVSLQLASGRELGLELPLSGRAPGYPAPGIEEL
jgi:hypothetical protein